jgi:hypothetical protein
MLSESTLSMQSLNAVPRWAEGMALSFSRCHPAEGIGKLPHAPCLVPPASDRSAIWVGVRDDRRPLLHGADMGCTVRAHLLGSGHLANQRTLVGTPVRAHLECGHPCTPPGGGVRTRAPCQAPAHLRGARTQGGVHSAVCRVVHPAHLQVCTPAQLDVQSGLSNG